MDNQKIPAGHAQRQVSDARLLVRRHLSDPNHVITDEEIASIRVGIAAHHPSPIENIGINKGPGGKAYRDASWESIE